MDNISTAYRTCDFSYIEYTTLNTRISFVEDEKSNSSLQTITLNAEGKWGLLSLRLRTDYGFLPLNVYITMLTDILSVF